MAIDLFYIFNYNTPEHTTTSYIIINVQLDK